MWNLRQVTAVRLRREVQGLPRDDRSANPDHARHLDRRGVSTASGITVSFGLLNRETCCGRFDRVSWATGEIIPLHPKKDMTMADENDQEEIYRREMATVAGVVSVLCNLPWLWMANEGNASPCEDVSHSLVAFSLLALGLGIVLGLFAGVRGSRLWLIAALLPFITVLWTVWIAFHHLFPCGM